MHMKLAAQWVLQLCTGVACECTKRVAKRQELEHSAEQPRRVHAEAAA